MDSDNISYVFGVGTGFSMGVVFMVSISWNTTNNAIKSCEQSLQMDAIRHNVAHYENGPNGEPIFKWGVKNESECK